jgi:uncharacterized protein YcbK (DUF882 family)
MGDLSQNFSKKEFECRDNCGSVVVHEKLIELLEKIRAKVDAPVYINSGYRCEAHNKKVGGVANSQHTKGTAADIRADGVNAATLFQIIKQLFNEYKIPELGYCQKYPTFVHVDVREKKANAIFNGN